MSIQLPEQIKRIWQALRWILLIVLFIALIGSLILVNEKYIHQPFWDWLDLLIIPVALGTGVWWFNQIGQENEQKRAANENRIEREIATDRNQEAAWQIHLDKMTEHLLDNGLRESEPG